MRQGWQEKKRFIVPAITAGLALLLALSLLFPKKVLDTYEINKIDAPPEDEQDRLLILPEGSVITYEFNTGSRPLRGIQPGISLRGGRFEKGVLRCRVYTRPGHVLASDNEYPLSELTESIEAEGGGERLMQARYMYIPFENYEACAGDITVEFTYESRGGTAGAPGLLTADAGSGAVTRQDGGTVDGGLAGYYVYTHNTYPLVYDLRILLVMSAAAWAAQGGMERKHRRTGKI